MEAFEELYCRISALELLVFAMAPQLNREAFVKDLAAQKDKLFATAKYSNLSPEVARRITLTVDRYARVLMGSNADSA